MKTLASNKKAYFNFEILDKFEAGLILRGWEVRSIKDGRFSIGNAYVKSKNNALYLMGSTVSASRSGFVKTEGEESRDRKLLLHLNQQRKILTASKERGMTIAPLEVYTNDRGLIKITIALARGVKKMDKRHKLKERDLKRRIDVERKKFNI